MFYITLADCVKIAVYEYNTECSETVVLIHGWPLSASIYEYQINLLIEQGYHVVAVDLRGFGKSDAPASGYSYDQMACDIYQIVCTLGLYDFNLVGFSMGGAIALRYMRVFRGYGVKKLILLSAAAPIFTQRTDFPYGLTCEAMNQLIDLAAADRPQLAYNFSHHQLFASCQSEAAKDWFEMIALSASGVGTIQSGISLREEDGRADLACVSVPTWLIHGEKDVVVSNDLVRLQQQGIVGSKLMSLKNSGHGIMYDELKEFNQCFFYALES